MDATSPAPRPAPLPWWSRFAEAPVTTGLVLLDVAVLAWVTLALGDPGSNEVAVAAGALERSRVWSGQWWRLGTAMTLHGGWGHLAVNAFFGFSWCRLVERALGARRFLLVYVVAGLAASAASLLAWDVISVGASGALFGVIGAALVLHRRALPGWRPFLRSPATVQVAVQLGAWTAVAVAASLHLDHAAHAGGLVAGAAVAWLLTAPGPRPAAWAALAAALAAALTAACWPRQGLPRFAADALERRVYQALRDKDQAAAAALFAEADRAGLADDVLAYYRALLEVQEGRLEAAATRLRPLALGGPSPARDEARRALGGVARSLGYRHYTGDGAPLDPERGLAWFDEACTAGDQASCRDASRIRGAPPP